MVSQKFKPGDKVALREAEWWYGTLDIIRLPAGTVIDVVENEDFIGIPFVAVYFRHPNAFRGVLAIEEDHVVVASRQCCCELTLIMTAGCQCGGT